MATLTVWRYDTAFGADAAEVRLKALRERGALTVHDAITVAWLPGATEPRIGHMHHATTTAAGKGSVLGALVGMLVLAPALGAAAGAGAATLAQRLHATGIDQTFLDQITAQLEPGTSTLLVLSTDADLDVVLPVLQRDLATGHTTLLHTELDDDAPAAIHQALHDLQNPPTHHPNTNHPDTTT